nr:LysR family transcriptional regulator [Thalassotalea atypica]
MEFYHLRSFVVVAQTGNLTLAAKQLCTTPPAISAHLKALEAELKTSLFIRSSKGMKLTAKGTLLLEKAQHTLDAAIDMVNLASANQHEVIGSFKLSINQAPDYLLVNDLLDNLDEKCPGISVEIFTNSTRLTLEKVRNGEIDGGYIYGNIPDDLFALPVRSQRITTIAAKDSPLTKSATRLALAQATWITMASSCPFDQLLSKQLKNHTNAKFKANDNLSRLSLVKAGHGLSFIEKNQALDSARNGDVKVLPQLDFETTLYFVTNKQRISEPLMKAMLQEVKVLWQIPCPKFS